jgi:hypothetical protein
MVNEASGMLAEEPASIHHADPALALLKTFMDVVGHFNLRNLLKDTRAFRVPRMLKEPLPRGERLRWGGLEYGKSALQAAIFPYRRQNFPMAKCSGPG